MWLFGKRDPVRIQNWSTVAFDDGFSSTSAYGSKIRHQLEFRLCRITGERDLRIDINLSRDTRELGRRHSGINKAKHKWIENGVLLLSDSAQVYNDDWECTIKPTDKSLGRWDHKPLTTVEQHLRNMKRCEEFRKLIAEHQMVADAYGEFETAVKLHSGIDNTK